LGLHFLEVAPVHDRWIDVDLPQKSVQLAPVLQFVLDDMKEGAANAGREIFIPPRWQFRDEEGPVQILVRKPGEESVDLFLGCPLVPSEVV
jgi:hypothetical protein